MASTARTSRRVDQIRERRTASARKPAPAARKRGKKRTYQHDTHAIPPVMVRVPRTSATPSKRTRAKNRRRYDVPLGIPGAEIRLPSLPQVRLGWRVVSFIMTAGLAFLIYNLWTTPRYRVEQAQVEGLQRISSQEVNALLDIGEKPIFAIDPTLLVMELQAAFPEFSTVTASVALPNSVAISVTERVPVLVWEQDGHTQLVDVEGVAFPLRSDAKAGSLPVVAASTAPPSLAPQPQVSTALDLAAAQAAGEKETSITPSQLLTPDMVTAVLTLAKQAPKDTPLAYDAQHGLGWKDERGWNVYFGDMEDMAMKLRVYNTLVKQLQSDETTPYMISIEYVHTPYYRLER
jgi:cell division protein FtsQ